MQHLITAVGALHIMGVAMATIGVEVGTDLTGEGTTTETTIVELGTGIPDTGIGGIDHGLSEHNDRANLPVARGCVSQSPSQAACARWQSYEGR